MLAPAFPITEFVGGRKNKDSLYTKLLSKQETVAAQIYDKLRFRIVTRSPGRHLPGHPVPVEAALPVQLRHPRTEHQLDLPLPELLRRATRTSRRMLPEMQAGQDDELHAERQHASAPQSYRVIHFVVDMPVRLPAQLTRARARRAAWALGPIIFVICEFQIIDRETEAANELGEASHAKYKERQKRAVMRRLQLGMREMKVPPSSTNLQAAAASMVTPQPAPAKPAPPPPPTPGPRKKKS